MPAKAASASRAEPRAGAGAKTKHVPRAKHQIATIMGSFEPNGSGASATTEKSSHAAILSVTPIPARIVGPEYRTLGRYAMTPAARTALN